MATPYIPNFAYTVGGDANSPQGTVDLSQFLPQYPGAQGGGDQGARFDAPADTANYVPPVAPPADPNAATVTAPQASAPTSGRSSFSSDYGSPFDPGGPLSFEVALPMAGAILGGSNLATGLGAAGQIAGASLANQRKRVAINKMLGSGAFANLDPQTRQYLVNNPDMAQQLIAYNILPRPPISVPAGATVFQYNPKTGTYEGGSSNARGGGSQYDVEQAQKAYDTEFGTGANVTIGAPSFNAWYRLGWPIFGTPQYDQIFHPQPTTPGGGSGGGGTTTTSVATPASLPNVPILQQPAPATVADLQRALAGGGSGTGAGVAGSPASTATPATAPPRTATLPQRGQSDTDIQREARTINSVQQAYTELPSYKAVVAAAPALARIKAAITNPGAVPQQDLVDAMTQLSKGGGNITEAQIKLIDENQGITDRVSSWLDRNLPGGPGGFLGPESKQQLLTLAKEVYNQYQTAYRPLYNEATKKAAALGVDPSKLTMPSPDLVEQLAGGRQSGSGLPPPAVGDVQQGFRFNGGNPADPNSWTRI